MTPPVINDSAKPRANYKSRSGHSCNLPQRIYLNVVCELVNNYAKIEM